MSDDNECGICLDRDIALNLRCCRQGLCSECYARIDVCAFCRRIFNKNVIPVYQPAQVNVDDDDYNYDDDNYDDDYYYDNNVRTITPPRVNRDVPNNMFPVFAYNSNILRVLSGSAGLAYTS